jgi:amidase
MNRRTYSNLIYDIIFENVNSVRKIYEYGFQQYINHESRINALTTPLDQSMIDAFIDKAKSQQHTVLKGLPVLIKDLILTKDFITTEGLPSNANNISDRDAQVVENIKKSGGIILGKTNVPPLGLDYQTFNPLFGVTNNPYDIERTPGGSSGGSASAIACSYAPFAVGSDFGGSLRIPASFTGIISLRPTQDQVSIDGHMALSHKSKHNYMVTIGPMAKTVDLVSILYQTMKGDLSLIKIKQKPVEELNLLISPSIRALEVDRRISNEIVKFSDKLTSLGAQIAIENVNLNSSLITKTYKALFNVNSNKKDEKEIPNWEKNQKMVQNEQLNILNEYDCWILPVCSTLAFKHNPERRDILVNDKSLNYWKALGQYCIPFSVSGFPVVTLPIGFSDHLPIGVQIVTRPNQEFDLLSICKTLENYLAVDQNRNSKF